MVALAHLRKFVAEHPLLFPDGGVKLLADASKITNPEVEGIMNAKPVSDLLGAHSDQFFELMHADMGYLSLSAEIATGHTSPL